MSNICSELNVLGIQLSHEVLGIWHFFHFKKILLTTRIIESNCWLQAYPEFIGKETDRDRHNANINWEISGWWKCILKPSGEWIPSDQQFSTLAPVRQSPPPAALSFSISWLNPPSPYLSLPAQGCFLSTSLFPPFLSSLISLSFAPLSLSLLPICYLPAGSVLRCTAVGTARIQAGWVTHSQSAALKPCRRQPHTRPHCCPRACTDVHRCILTCTPAHRIPFSFLRKEMPAHTHTMNSI